MYKSLFLITIIFCSIIIFSAFSLGVKSKVNWLVATTHDFGEIQKGNPAKFQFQFINASDTPITIDNVRTSCGCTAPNWTETPIEPKDTSFIEIKYDAKKIGYFKKKISVYFSGQKKAEKLYIEGEVVK